MARPATPPHTAPAHAPWIWPLTLVLIAVLGIAPVVPLADFHPAAAAGHCLVAIAAVAAAELLRRRQQEMGQQEYRLTEQLRRRDEELVERDTQWRSFTENEAERTRLETEHTVTERLPAVLRKQEVPGPLHDDLPLADILTRLVTGVADEMEDREESQRLALVELANRVQTSAHRIQAASTGMAGRYPADTDLLETSMSIDHAATQQARHAQSLKVLCGDWPGQQWQRPLALVDVVRAASGRILAYQRVEVTGDPDVGVTPVIVEPLIHLIAELLANATEYSPPKTGVPVTVRTVQRGAVIEVDDGGLGLDEYRLSESREVVSGRRLLSVGDVGEIPQTGFAVVGRFARRHDFHVDVGPSPYGGVRAVVLVPSRALETLAPLGVPVRKNAPAAPPAPSEPAPPTMPALPASAGEAPVPQPADHGRTDHGPADHRAPADPHAPGQSPTSAAQHTSDPGAPVADAAMPSPAAETNPAGDSGWSHGSAVSGQQQPYPTGSAASGVDLFGTGVDGRSESPGAGASADGPPPSRGGAHAAPEPAVDPAPQPTMPGAGNSEQPADGPAAEDQAPRSGRRLPRRRSRRGEYSPAAAAGPSAEPPPGTPEEAGDWMNRFFTGGREGASLDVTAPGEDGDIAPPSSPTPNPSEGQT